MKKRIFMLTRWLFPAVFILVVISGAVTGAQAEPYYKGKAITLINTSAAGGGGDIWARMVVRHLQRHVPGKPSIVVRNMTAAGGLVAANHVWHAKPDGRKILFGTGKTVTTNLVRPKGTEFKLEEMLPLYAAPFGVVFYFKPGIVSSPKDIVNAKGIIWGHGAATGGTSSVWIYSKAILGFKSKDILGYSGSGPAKLAFYSGESNAMGAGSDSYVAAYKIPCEKGEMVALFQCGLLDPDGNVIRDPSAPPIPTTQEVYEEIYGKSPSGPMWDVYKLGLTTRTYDNPIVMSPRTKPEYYKIMQKAFVDMSKDPEFIKTAKLLAPSAVHLTGDRLTKGFAKQVAGDAKTIKLMKDFLTKNYDIVF